MRAKRATFIVKILVISTPESTNSGDFNARKKTKNEIFEQ